MKLNVLRLCRSLDLIGMVMTTYPREGAAVTRKMCSPHAPMDSELGQKRSRSLGKLNRARDSDSWYAQLDAR